MAKSLLIVLMIVSTVCTAAQSRNCFLPRTSATHSFPAGTCVNHNDAADGSIQASTQLDIEGGENAAPAPTSRHKQHNPLETVFVILAPALISGVIITLIRMFCNQLAHFLRRSEENEPTSIEMEIVGPERPAGEENEHRPPNGIKSVGPERPMYEPRPIPAVNYEVTIFSCNFPLCGSL